MRHTLHHRRRPMRIQECTFRPISGNPPRLQDERCPRRRSADETPVFLADRGGGRGAVPWGQSAGPPPPPRAPPSASACRTSCRSTSPLLPGQAGPGEDRQRVHAPGRLSRCPAGNQRVPRRWQGAERQCAHQGQGGDLHGRHGDERHRHRRRPAARGRRVHREGDPRPAGGRQRTLGRQALTLEGPFEREPANMVRMGLNEASDVQGAIRLGVPQWCSCFDSNQDAGSSRTRRLGDPDPARTSPQNADELKAPDGGQVISKGVVSALQPSDPSGAPGGRLREPEGRVPAAEEHLGAARRSRPRSCW